MHPLDALALCTSILLETSILSMVWQFYIIYMNVLRERCQSNNDLYCIKKTDLISITTIFIVNVFSKGSFSSELILIPIYL